MWPVAPSLQLCRPIDTVGSNGAKQSTTELQSCNPGYKQDMRLDSVGTTLVTNAIDSMDVFNVVAAYDYRNYLLFSTPKIILWRSNGAISAKKHPIVTLQQPP